MNTATTRSLRERLPTLIEQQGDREPRLRAQLAHPVLGANGVAADMLAGHLRFLAVAAFALDGDVSKFRSLMREAVCLRLQLFERFDVGEPISPSFVSMLAYKDLFGALAVGDISLAVRFAQRMGGRQKIEQEYDNRFTRGFGYALKWLVLGSNDARRAIGEFRVECAKTKSYLPYADCLEAIATLNSMGLEAALKGIAKAHKRLSASGSMFHLTEDEIVCTWGLGLANLAAQRGLSVGIDNAFIPRELLAV